MTFVRKFVSCLLGVAVFGFCLQASAADDAKSESYQWLGATRDGVFTETITATGTLKELWSVKVGIGYGSPTVAAGKLYISGSSKIDGKNNDTVFCFDAKTGKELWKYSYPCPTVGSSGNFPGPRISACVKDEFVIIQSIQGNLFCFDADTGNLKWQKDLAKLLSTTAPKWGFSGSPLIDGNTVVVDIGVVASFNIADGKLNWKSNSYKHGYSSPTMFEKDGKKYYAVFNASGLVVLDSTGTEISKFPWKTSYDVTATTPIVTQEGIFISTGYNVGAALVKFEDGQLASVWQNKKFRNHFANSILHDGLIFGFDGDVGESKFKCISLKEGKEIWVQPGSGSLIRAGDQLIVLKVDGKLEIGAASADGFKPTASANLTEGQWWTPPVLSSGMIYCRSHEGDLVCLSTK